MNGLIEVGEIVGKNFFVPSYQRGYRWQAEHEVSELLEDLYEFFTTKLDENDNNYYCLQPLVVKKNNTQKGQLTIVDGQQRLTTFYLIYKIIFKKAMFDLTYETRIKSKDFLENIDKMLQNFKDNIDFFHIYEAYNKILSWFEDIDKLNLFKKHFLTKTKIIWYEIPELENEIDVFLRLNIGKIPLTNAELVKAIFLSKSEDESDTLKERARTWYDCEIETRKNKDKAYCLFNNIKSEDVYSIYGGKELNDDITRIEMFFSILSNKINTNDDPHAIFKYYYSLMKTKSRNKVWKEFAKCQSILLSIANPSPEDVEARILYHYLGFLIYIGKYTVNDFWKLLIIEEHNQAKIIKILENIIKERFNSFELNELSYVTERKILTYVLLLLNLVDLNKNKIGNRKDFEFNRFKMELWSLEHIIPQSLKDKKSIENIVYWLDDLYNYTNNKNVKLKIGKIKTKIDKNKDISKDVEELETIISAYETDIHTISNLVLLDRESNSRLGTETFCAKRAIIRELYTTDKLIPQCTGEVFEKTYSKVPGNPNIWSVQDRNQYFDFIKKTLDGYIEG